MSKRKSEINFKEMFPLLDSNAPQDEKTAEELSSSFFQAFEGQWKRANAKLKRKMILFAGGLPIENGLRPVLLGLKDFVGDVRKEAQTAIERLFKQTVFGGDTGLSLLPDVVKRSAYFAFIIYKEMKASTINLELVAFLFQTLLKMGGRGTFLSWKFFNQGMVPHNMLIGKIRKFSEKLRLIFVFQYTLDNISVRRNHKALPRLLLNNINDRNTVVDFLADLFDQGVFLDAAFEDLCQRLKISKTVIQTELQADNQETNVKGLKVIGYLEELPGYYSCLPLLSSDEHKSVRVECLKMLARANAKKDQKIIQAVYKLLDDKDQDVALHALSSLVSLKATGLSKAAPLLFEKYPSERSYLCDCLSKLEFPELKAVLDALPPDQSIESKATISREIVKNNPDKLIFFLNQYTKNSNDKIQNKALKLLATIDSIKKKELDEASEDNTPASFPLGKVKKGFFDRITGGWQRKALKQLLNREPVKDADFQGEVLSNVDLKGVNLQNVNFDRASFSNVNLSSAKLQSVTFKGARFENVKMENATLDSVSFESAVLKGVTAASTQLRSCDLGNSWIYGSSFDSADLTGSSFGNAKITKTDFSGSNLTETYFVGASLSRVAFNYAILDLSDFSLVSAKMCDFLGVDFTAVTRDLADLNARSALFGDIKIPALFFENDPAGSIGFNLLIVSEEIDRLRERFLEFNRSRTELALDIFSPEDGDLFELIPFVVDSNLALLPVENPIQNAPAGIFGYHPNPKTLRLAKKHLIVDDSRISLDKKANIEGLFTIGSIGTIAQSVDSDIDYWVCVEKDELGDKGCELLQAKLQAIEEWAFKVFSVEIHFFLVDLPSVRENSFGGSDQESSGSAQGKILKEEFYRTMLFVAGKLPLWCATPPWLNDNYHEYLVELAPRLYKDYVDMGTISSIPKGEYFGASIWQIFKSLKSPYKSVIKMSLLDKYIQEEGHSVLLCDRLKSSWSLGRSDLRSLDPYVLLFEEVLEYCQRTDQKNPESLLKVCFFLKLGIQSISDLDNLVIRVRKKVVQGYIDAWGWDEKRVQDLGRFKEWNFDKIFQLSSKINHYMIETYKRSSRALKDTEDRDTIITQRDLTILGRKMFVQFSRQPHKVEKLPLVASGKSLFQRLNLQYSQQPGKTATWSLYHLKTATEKRGENNQLLKKTARIEEIAIWLVHNGLYSSTTSIELMPNPTPISIQDVLDLLKKLRRVFPSAEADLIAPEALLLNAQPRKLLIAVNFNLSRKLNRIHEYTVFYTTSWGELFCRFFRDKQGDASLEDALKKVEKQLELKISSSQVSFFIPEEARKSFNRGIIL